jgi:hypothetical protein
MAGDSGATGQAKGRNTSGGAARSRPPAAGPPAAKRPAAKAVAAPRPAPDPEPVLSSAPEPQPEVSVAPVTPVAPVAPVEPAPVPAAIAVPVDAARRAGANIRIVAVIAACVVFVAVAAAAAAAWSSGRPDVFAARSDVRFRAVDDPAFGAADRAIAAQQQAVKSRSVLVPAAERLGVDVDVLEDDVSVELVPGSDVLHIEARGPSTTDAERTLQAVVDVFVARVEAETPQQGRAFLEMELTALAERIDDVVAALQEPERDPEASASLQLQAEYVSLLEQQTRLREIATEMEVRELDAPRVDVLTEPYADPEPVAPVPMRSAAVAGVAAALVALGGAYLVLRRPALT